MPDSLKEQVRVRRDSQDCAVLGSSWRLDAVPRLADDRTAFFAMWRRHAVFSTRADRADAQSRRLPAWPRRPHKPPVEQLGDAALGLQRCARGLVEYSTHLATAVRDAMAAVDASTLILS